MRDAKFRPDTSLDRAPAAFVILGQASGRHAILPHFLQMTKTARTVTIPFPADAS